MDLLKEHKAALAEFEKSEETIEQITELIIAALKNAGTVYLCGNGGSAADCQHIAGEFVGRFKRNRKPLPAIALSTDTSVITCIGNDYNYDDVFTRQIEAMVKTGDVLWAFSTSGASSNILKAVKLAKKKNANVIAFTGKPGSELESLSDLCICANTNQTSTAQEIHMLAYHIICEVVDKQFTD